MAKIQAILTDIEGTTSSIEFVHKRLFPYASEHLEQFLKDQHAQPAIAKLLTQLQVRRPELLSSTQALSLHNTTVQLQEWITADEKQPELKALQGYIWEAGYLNGTLKAHVYPDAHEYIQRWAEQMQLPVYVYSSGSIKAQQLFFAHTEFGDMSNCFQGYFDTTSGPKQARQSYQQIVTKIDCPPKHCLFLSDIEAEIQAAQSAGLQTCLVVRSAGGATATTLSITNSDANRIATDFAQVHQGFFAGD